MSAITSRKVRDQELDVPCGRYELLLEETILLGSQIRLSRILHFLYRSLLSCARGDQQTLITS